MFTQATFADKVRHIGCAAQLGIGVLKDRIAPQMRRTTHAVSDSESTKAVTPS